MKDKKIKKLSKHICYLMLFCLIKWHNLQSAAGTRGEPLPIFKFNSCYYNTKLPVQINTRWLLSYYILFYYFSLYPFLHILSLGVCKY